jgi:hypothetical protein
VDLYVSKGNVSEQEGYATRDPGVLFVGQPDGSFVERTDPAGLVNFDRGRGAALVDLDADGLLDLVEVKLDAPVRVYRNLGSGAPGAPAPMGRWLAVAVEQAGANRDAVGAVLEVAVGELTARRELVVGGGHAGGVAGPLHVGVGPAERVRLRVRWPDGTIGPWLETASDRALVVRRGVDGAADTIADAGATGD